MSAEDAAAYVAKMALRRRSSPLKALGAPYKAAAAAAKLLPPAREQLHRGPHVRKVSARRQKGR